MSKALKVFSLDSKEKFTRYLNALIHEVYIQLKKYEQYKEELSVIIMAHIDFDENNKIVDYRDIDSNVYESIDDKLHNISMNLIKKIGDCSNGSYSYFKYRKLIEKNKLSLSYSKLSDEVRDYLKEINDLRNWMFHNPESILNADLEMYKANIPKEFRDYIQVKLIENPIKVVSYELYSLKWAISLELHHEKRLDMFQKIFNSMKKDYELLIGERLIIQENRAYKRELLDYSSEVVQLSMAIQKKKYKGDEKQLKNVFKILSNPEKVK